MQPGSSGAIQANVFQGAGKAADRYIDFAFVVVFEWIFVGRHKATWPPKAGPLRPMLPCRRSPAIVRPGLSPAGSKRCRLGV